MQAIKQALHRAGKSVRHFLLGLTPRMRLVSCLLLAILVAIGVLIGVLLQDNTKQSNGKAATPLFPLTERAQVQTITLHPKEGEEYAITRVIDKESGTSTFTLVKGGVEYTWLTLGAETFSELVVGAGQNRVYEAVISKPEGPEGYESQQAYEQACQTYERRLQTYGLKDEDCYYTLEDINGNTYTVYYGKKDVTGAGYYLRLKGRDTVYVSNTAEMGDFLGGTCEQFVSGMTLLPASNNTLAYNYPRRFETVRRLGAGSVIENGDTVALTVRIDGGAAQSLSVDLSKYPVVFSSVLVGKTVGSYETAPLTFDASFTDAFGLPAFAGTTKHFEVLSVDGIDRLWFGLNFIQASERGQLHKFSIYQFYAPTAITACDPSGSNIPAILEELYGMSGTVVKIGLDEQAMQQYGLYANRILFEYPIFDEESPYKKDEEGNDTDDINPAGYLTSYLYVSAPNKDGKRYVASPLYGVVAEVEADTLSYLEEDFSGLVDRFAVNAAIVDISRVDMTWNFGSEAVMDKASVRLDITTEKYQASTGSSTQERLATIRATLTDKNGNVEVRQLATDGYTNFFYILYYIQYGGSHGLDQTQLDAMRIDPEAACLTMTLYFKDGGSLHYRFVPLSSNRTAIMIKNNATGQQNDRFYVYATDIKALSAAYIAMLDKPAT